MKVNGDLKFRTLGSGELQNAIIERVAGGVGGGSLPTGVAGRIAYNTDSNTYWFHDGTQWQEFGGGGDITNVINSGGYMNANGTFNESAFSGFNNVTGLGSPTNGNLVEILAQLDAAIAAAAGVDTLDELTDTTIGALSSGQILYYKDGTDKWTQTSVVGLGDGDILVWDGGSSNWVPTDQTNITSLGELTDVDGGVPGTGNHPSASDNGKILRYNSGASSGSEWSAENLGYIVSADGNTYISLTGAGSINPRTSGDSIHMYIDDGGSQLVTAITSSTYQIDSRGTVDIDSAAGGGITINTANSTGTAAGDISLTAGSSNTTEGGDITLTAGGGQDTVGSGDVIIQGGSNTDAPGAQVTVGGGGISNDGGNLTLSAGDGTGTDGQLSLYSGTSGTGTGVIQIQTAGRIQNKAPYIEVVNTTAANAGVVRFQEGTTNGTQYVGLQAPAAVTTSVTYTLPVSPTDTYLLQTNGSGTLSWVDPDNIGGDSFSTWSRSGGTGDASIVADSTSDTVTLTSSAGININLNSTTDTVTFSMVVSGLTDTNAIVGADKLWFSDGPGTTAARTFTNMLADLNIVNNVSGTGLVVQTAADTYASRTITASAVNNRLGIGIVNGDGVAGNPTIGLNVVGLTDIGGTPASDDELVIYDTSGTVNRKVSVSDLTAGIVGAGLALDDISDVQATGPTAGDILVYGVGSPATDWVSIQPGPNSGIQSYDAGLTSIANLTLTANDFIYVSDGSPETFSTLASGTTGRALLGDENVSDAITTLGLDKDGASDIWVNNDGDTMSGDLVMQGSGSPATCARVILCAGTQARPSLTFEGDTDTGLFTTGGNEMMLVSGGAQRLRIGSGGNITVESGVLRVQDGTAADPSFTFESDTTKGMYNDGSGHLAFSTTGSQRLKIYGTATVGSPEVSIAGAISVENTASYENLIPDPTSSGFTAPVDDFLPNAQWVDLYYLKKSGGTMTGDLIFSSADLNMGGNSITNVAAPSSALDATNKNYVDNLVSSGAVWVNPIRNPDLVGIAASEPTNPLSSGAYIAYGGSYPQYWSPNAGSPSGSPLIEVNEYDVMHYTFGAWDYSTNLVTGFSNARFGAGVFTNALDTTPGQNLDGTGIRENDLIEYIGGPASDPSDSANWIYPHGRVGGVTFGVISVTAATDTFVIEGDQSASFHVGNTFLYSGSGSPGGTGSPSVAGTYTIQSVTVTSTSPLTTEVVVDEDITEDVTGGYVEPELRDGITTLTSNEDDTHFGQSYLYVADNNEWVQISGPGNVDAGVGLSYAGNTLNVNLGAGIFELPNDEVGIELYNSASGAIILTTNGSTRDNGSDSQLHLLLDGTGGLDQGTSGLKIAAGGVTNAMLENGSGINISGDAGTPTDAPLGGSIVFNGTDGVVVTVGAGGGSPSQLDVTVDLDSVPNSALTNNSIGFADGTTTDEVALGEDTTITGGIVGANTFKIRRIEDADGDTYVQTSTGVADDSDTVSIAVPGTTSATFSATEVDITSDGALDLNADTTVTVDSGTSLTLTGGADATLSATTLDVLVQAVAGSVELQASTAVEVLDNIDLRLMDADNSAYIGHKSNATVTSSITYEWPEAPAANDYVLTSTTGGVMSWKSPSEVGRTRLEDLDDVVVNVGSPGEGYIGGQVLVASGGSPNKFESKQIQYIYDSQLLGSPSAATSHTINHNLGQKYVNVTIYNSSDQQIIPQSVELDSATALTVTFNKAIDCVVVITGVAGVTAADGS